DYIKQLRELKQQLKPLLALQWQRDLETISIAALKEKRKALGDKEPPLEDPLAVWSQIFAGEEKGTPLAETSAALTTKYDQEQTERGKKNDDNFTVLADFRDGVPAGWSVDGVAFREITPRGDFTVALSGDTAVGQILPGGLFSFAVSPRLNGTL